MMDVRRMQMLRAVVSSGSVTRAATHLGYTPSAVSQQIAVLEKESGIALLDRVGRGVRPTAAGRLVSEHAAVISQNMAQAESALADLRNGCAGRLALRYFATAGATLVAPAIARFDTDFPGVRLDLRLTDSDDPLRQVEHGDADVALVVRAGTDSSRTPSEGVRLVHLFDDAYAAVLPVGHRLVAKGNVKLSELEAERWVGSEPPGPCLDPILGACAAAGFTPDFAVQSEDYATAQGFVAAGLGVGVMPRMGLQNRHPGVVTRPLCNPEPVRAVYAAVREAAMTQPPVRGLLTALKAAAQPDAAAL